MAARRPRLAVIVANTITGDSRVQKTAIAAARDGWDVTLIGRASGDRRERSRMGPIRVVRVPVERDVTRAARMRRRRTITFRAARFGLPSPTTYKAYVSSRRSRDRLRSEHIGRLRGRRDPVSRARRLGLRLVGRLDRTWLDYRVRLYEWAGERAHDDVTALGDWRLDAPQLLDLELAMGPVLEELEPDVIHANDVTTLHVAATAAARLRARGRSVAWIYDAHEYVAGVGWPTERLLSAYPQLEAEYIGLADAVVTVSPEIADALQRNNGLPTTPHVVRNAPVRETARAGSGASVRDAAGVPDGAPLLVYSGYVDEGRGLGLAVEAMVGLPGTHLAIVANRHNPAVAELERTAARLGVHDRVHVVPYVPVHQVPGYLSTADVGILCLKRSPQYELSLPTKVAEYLHAGLPILTSDVETLAAFVAEHQVGRSYVGGDVESFREQARAILAEAPELASHIGDDLLEEHSWEHQAAKLLELYRELSGAAPEPREGPRWTVPEGPVRRQAVAQADAPDDADRGIDDVPWRRLSQRSPVRLGLGVANYAGQLSSIAQAVTRARPDVSAEVITRTTGAEFGYPADVYVAARSLTRLEGQVEQLQRIMPRYSHLVADAFLPVLGSLNGSDISADLPALRTAGIKVALLGHGSEVRHPVHHMERVPASHFFDAPEGVVDNLVRTAERNRATAETAGLPVFVTTPDLLVDLPMATWIPLVVDVAAWETDRRVMERSRPIVLHAPSKRWTKGTDRFLGDLEEMERQGHIELRIVEGVPWATMRDLVQDADIVVDQVAIGSYGTFACEAMAAGKPVIAHLTPDVAEVIGEQPPIVNTPPDQVAATVQQLLDDPSGTVETGVRSLEYVRRLHDGRRSAEVLDDFLSR